MKAYKYRLYPNIKQEILLNKTFGCVRYFWNQQVAIFNSYDKEINPKPVYKTSTELRSEIDWLREISAGALQQKEIDFKQFKKQHFNKSRKAIVNRPKFKKKGEQNSYRLPNQKVILRGERVWLEKIGNVKYVQDRPIPENGKIMSGTISKNSSGQYFISILVDQQSVHKGKTNRTVGVDVGLKQFITTSDNEVVHNPKYFRESQSKLKRMQQHLSRKKKGSSRHKKCKLKAARLYQKVSNQRDFFLHNVSTNLVNNYDTIVIEDLNVKGMVKNRKLSKSISDASFSKLFTQLQYKCDWYGKSLIKIGRFEPTSKTCSNCANVKKELKLSQRVYNCEACGHSQDRDLNAALNIKALGVNNAIRTQSDNKTSLLANCSEVFKIM